MDGTGQLIALLHLREIAAGIATGVTGVVGFATTPEFAERVAHAIDLEMLSRGTVYTLAMVAGLFALIYPLERFTRSQKVAYAGRNFRQDVLYGLFYMGGFYNVLMWAAVSNALDGRLAFLKVEILAGLPGAVHFAIYWIAVDFMTYWWHRLLHTWGPLWDIHSVHHTQTEMNFMTAYRAHPLEQFMQNLIMVVPLLVMGVPTFRWLPILLVRSMLEALQHSALDWDYGRIYRVVVSPRFHAIHHSTDPGHYNANYSKIFSVWDFLFGTAVREDRRPVRLGVAGLPVPGSLAAQLLAPFHLMARRWSAPAAAPAPVGPPPILSEHKPMESTGP